MIPEQKLRNRTEWLRCVTRYAPAAFARTTLPYGSSHPRVDNVKHMFSGVPEYGHRYWAFETVEERDQFVAYWPMAEACEDPMA